MRRSPAILAGAGLVLVGLIALTLANRTFRDLLDETASLASWAVAAGTLVLALATFQLARRAREEAEAVRVEAAQVGDQVALQRAQLEAGVRAYVYPWVPHDWAAGIGYWSDISNIAMLPLKNGGPGLALNACGRVFWNLASGRWRMIEMFASSIASNDILNARLAEEATDGWVGAFGFVRYSDLRGREWATYFRFEHGEGDQLMLRHLPPEQFDEVDDPDRLNAADIAARTRR